MIRSSARVSNPEAVDVQITLEMTVGDWRRAALLLDQGHPGYDLARIIRKVVATVDEQLSETHESGAE